MQILSEKLDLHIRTVVIALFYTQNVTYLVLRGDKNLQLSKL